MAFCHVALSPILPNPQLALRQLMALASYLIVALAQQPTLPSTTATLRQYHRKKEVEEKKLNISYLGVEWKRRERHDQLFTKASK